MSKPKEVLPMMFVSVMMLITLILGFASFTANAQTINNQTLGSGVPGAKIVVVTPALPVFKDSKDILHAPQYMPGYPTAAIIWPRVIEVPCEKLADETLKCDGYEWMPKFGRGEYLFFQPIIKKKDVPLIVEKLVPVDRPVFIEVLRKKKGE